MARMPRRITRALFAQRIIRQQAVEGIDLDVSEGTDRLRGASRMRSSTLKSGALASLRRMDTISRSKSREPRSITSRWPLVIGSNDPG